MSSRKNHDQSATGRRKGDKYLVCKESRPRDPPQLLDRNLPTTRRLTSATLIQSRLKLDSNMPMGAEMDTAMALNVADPTSGFPLHLTQRIELSSQHDDFFPGDAAAMLTPSAPHSAAIFPSTTTVTDGQTAAAPDVGGPHNPTSGGEYASARAIAKMFKRSRERNNWVEYCIQQNTAGLRSHRGLDGSPSMEADPCCHFLGNIDEAFPAH
ncbi:unnamed protein product [Parascedosporium putredinis]|uniref:Uncharacterized protein n=1 Tax=Parascedosporium putredinis TaxID=1442378 RepID=A0A9P1H6W8_9PEZI|nr:unnamed protein product [Parascedosporium putredinis]CAI7999028.1 unnamed protein product [Parascedosporium putredinis]